MELHRRTRKRKVRSSSLAESMESVTSSKTDSPSDPADDPGVLTYGLTVSPAEFARVMEICENPPEPTQALIDAVREYDEEYGLDEDFGDGL